MRASGDSGGKSRSQHSQLGLNSSIASVRNRNDPALRDKVARGERVSLSRTSLRCPRKNNMTETKPTRLIGMSGSLRTGSYSNAVLQTLREKFAGVADLTVWDLAPIPLYNQDFEGEKRPAPVKEFLAAIAEADGLVLCAPEFNHSIPGVLKNALDWA